PVPGLVCVDESEVELLAAGQRSHRVESWAEAQLDPVGHPRLGPELPGDIRPLLTYVTAEEATLGTHAPCDCQGRVAGERADFDGAPGVHGTNDQFHEDGLIVTDLHSPGSTRLVGSDGLQFELHAVGAGAVVGRVLG